MRLASRLVIGLVALILLVPSTVWADQASHHTAFGKLTRGFFNTVTGWVEIPKRIHETSQTSGAAAGFTWGVLRGIGYGFVRTAAGLYELVTFPVPAPPNYEPVIVPEFVFTDEVGNFHK